MPRSAQSPLRRQVALASAGALLAAVVGSSVFAAEVPPAGVLTYLQTNGPTSAIGNGDWYTSNANGAVAGYHYVQFTVPCAWPSTLPVMVDLQSPSIVVDEVGDEVAPTETLANGNNTIFELYGPGTQVGPGLNQPGPGATGSIATQTFTPLASVTGTGWVRFHTIAAPVACGTYLLRAETQGDDQNSWRLRFGTDTDTDPTNAPPANYDNPDGLPATGDEVIGGLQNTSYQHNQTTASVSQCLTLYEYVAPAQASTRFHNFDLDSNQRVRYYPPSATLDPAAQTGGVAGTVSAGSVWNNGGTQTTRGGDVITNPETGWWRIVTCVNNQNQYIQEGQTGVPSFYAQPPTPNMTLAKTDGVTTARPGDVLTYTLSYANIATGPTAGAALSTVIRDTIPANTTYVGCSPTATCSEAGGVVTFNLGTVAAGASGSVTVSVRVNSNAVESVTNNATLTYTDNLNNPFPPRTAQDIDLIPPTPDLSITKSTTATAVGAGDTVIYSLNYANIGNVQTTGVVVNETVPAESTFVAASSTAGWSCANGSAAGTACTFTVGTLNVGQTGSVTFAVRLNSPLPTSFTGIQNSVTITDDGSRGPDPTPNNNISQVRVPLRPSAVTLTSFTATREAGSVVLRWATASEQNTTGFVVYRGSSTDRSGATQVTPDVIAAQGQGGNGASYSWQDVGATSGDAFYWLVEVESGVNANEYGPVAVRQSVSANGLTIFVPLLRR